MTSYENLIKTVCTFTCLSFDLTKEILDPLTPKERIKSLLHKCLEFDKLPTEAFGVVYEMYERIIKGCFSFGAGEKKTSTILGIFKSLIDFTRSERVSRTVLNKAFKEMIENHCSKPFSKNIGVFNKEDIIFFNNLFLEDFYRNFSLYQYMLEPKDELSLKVVKLAIPAQSKIEMIKNEYLFEKPEELSDLVEFFPTAPKEIEKKEEEIKKEPEIKVSENVKLIVQEAEKNINEYLSKSISEKEEALLAKKGKIK